MEDLEYEFMLQDRIAKIKSINEQYDLEKNAYIAFSGGKDSTILHHLIDMALPNNKIPRVFANTGIEYNLMVKFVKRERERDSRIQIINQTRNIKKTLNEYGYPFKSKEHSLRVEQFNNNNNKNYILKYTHKTEYNGKFVCPKILMYQFDIRGKYNYSNKCCYKLKKDLSHKWQKDNKKTITITGMRNEEGGNRARLSCLSSNNTKFHPLIVCSDEWENEFVKRNNIQLCELYYPPYNFKRTGCKGCPYSLQLQQDLLTMKKLLPKEYKQCLHIWKTVYDEYIRIGYRLSKDFYELNPQYTIDDFIGKGE